MAKPVSKAPNADTQFQTRGYVISEESDFALRDLFSAMDATAFAYDVDCGNANYDLTGEQVAAILRSFARLGRSLLLPAPFAHSAMVRPRQDSVKEAA